MKTGIGREKYDKNLKIINFIHVTYTKGNIICIAALIEVRMNKSINQTNEYVWKMLH